MPVSFQHSTKPVTGRALPSGTCSLLTWSRLESSLRVAGVVRPSETIGRFIVSEEGIHFEIEKRGG